MDKIPKTTLLGRFGHSPQNQTHALLVNCAENQQVITKLGAPAPICTAFLAPTATDLLFAPPLLLSTRSCKHVTFCFGSALQAPAPQRFSSLFLGSCQKSASLVSRQHQAFSRILLFQGRRRGEVKIANPTGCVEGHQIRLLGPPERERSRKGSSESHMQHFWTPEPTRRARVPRGAGPALWEPEASRGAGSPGAYKFPPHPRAGR